MPAAIDPVVDYRVAEGPAFAPADLAGAAILLASEAGAYITGQTIFVDGGLTSVRPW